MRSFRARRSPGRSSRARRFSDAQLQGAALSDAQLQGAALNEAQLQGAWLVAAQLQGASLKDAALWRAQLRNSVVKDLFVPAESPDWTEQDATYAELRRSIERAVPEGPNRDLALERAVILDCARQRLGDDALASCDPAAAPPDTVKVWKKMIEAAKVDQGAYGKALAAIFGDLVCSDEPDRIYVLRGLLSSNRFVETGTEMPALAKRITSRECPVSMALTDADKAAIANVVSLSKPR
jgi:hypothetical protein